MDRTFLTKEGVSVALIQDAPEVLQFESSRKGVDAFLALVAATNQVRPLFDMLRYVKKPSVLQSVA